MTDFSIRAMANARRCGARTRAGKPCGSPAVRSKKRCRMHGGAAGSGAPIGNKNALKGGMYTRDMLETGRTLGGGSHAANFRVPGSARAANRYLACLLRKPLSKTTEVTAIAGVVNIHILELRILPGVWPDALRHRGRSISSKGDVHLQIVLSFSIRISRGTSCTFNDQATINGRPFNQHNNSLLQCGGHNS
jgi:hypothetical protein